LAVNNSLGVQANWGRSVETVHDVEPVSKGRCGALGPARAAVLRNVLVLVPGHVVSAVHVSPVYIFWQDVNGENVPRVRSGLHRTVRETGLGDTTAFGFR
jgi:hypothetical protein